MKTNVSIKFNSIEEYREIEKKLEELGYVNDKEWNESIFIIKNINKGHVYISKVYFSAFSDTADNNDYNSLEEFLKDYGMEENKKKYCKGCDKYVDYLDNWGTNGEMLCEDCNEKYDNTTGFCSLECCLGNGCDQSC